MESEKLTNIGFLRQGKALYVFPAHEYTEYFELHEGDPYGLADMAFKVSYEYNKYQKLQREQQMRRSISSEQSMVSEFENKNMFDVLYQRVYCKFTIKAKTKCLLLQMEKSNIMKMKVEFPDAFFSLWNQERDQCEEILKEKAIHNRFLERKKKADCFNGLESLSSETS